MTKLFVIKIDESNEDILLDKMSLLSLSEIENMNKRKIKSARASSVAGRLMLFTFADKFKKSEYKNLNIFDDFSCFTNESVVTKVLVYDKYGKPSFKDEEDIFFNISHSGNYCVCAFSDKPVGVDIQMIRPLKQNIAEKYFNNKDVEYVYENEKEIVDRTIRVWCAKESFSKLTGKGFSQIFGSFYMMKRRKKLSQNLKNSSFQMIISVCALCIYNMG